MDNNALTLLGQTVKMYRERAGLSQFRFADFMGWQGTAPVVAIEKGQRRPRPDTLKKVAKVLKLSPADIHYLRGLAGYLDPTEIPPLEQVRSVLDLVDYEASNHPYPVYIVDYQFKYWLANASTALMLDGSTETLRNNMKKHTLVFDLVFNSESTIRKSLMDPYKIEEEQVFRFKAYNLYRRHESFYMSYPSCMKERLNTEDYIRFEMVWNRVNVDILAKAPIHPTVDFKLGGVEFHFLLHNIELLHLNRLFFLVYYIPREDIPGNKERCEHLFSQYNSDNNKCIRLWD